MISPWIIIGGLLLIIILLWLVWPREYLASSADLPSLRSSRNPPPPIPPPPSEIPVCLANPPPVAIPNEIAKSPPLATPVGLADSPQPDGALLSEYVPPSPYVNTGELRQRVNTTLGPRITTIISTPNPRTAGRFVSRGEQICRLTMEAIYGVPFPTVRPSWLVNPETGHLLELDCYNEQLNLAVEYNGKQHYHYDGPDETGLTVTEATGFHRSQAAFEASLRRDSYKRKLCRDHHVFLIIVPYTVANRDIPNFIVSFLPEVIRQRSKGTVDELTERLED